MEGMEEVMEAVISDECLDATKFNKLSQLWERPFSFPGSFYCSF